MSKESSLQRMGESFPINFNSRRRIQPQCQVLGRNLSFTMEPEMIQKVKEEMNRDPAAAAGLIHEYVEKKQKVPLNIGITGQTGAGKSTFINAFRGMSNMDENAAPTGVVQTTRKVTPYSHPKYPNVILWDLPGVGSPEFPIDNYLQLVGFKKFEFFIIISDTRFKENDVKLARDIQKMGKKFYFVRSKIDNDINAQKRSVRNFNEAETLTQIKEDIVKGLQQQGFESPQIFLTSSFHLQLYDFSLLHETLERELPEHQRYALLLAMPNISLEVINKKKEALQSEIKYYAVLSAAGAAIPIPGLSVAIDIPMIVLVVKHYVNAFGLDQKSLRSLSDSTGVPFKDLNAAVKSVLPKSEITIELITKVLLQITNIAALMLAEEVTTFIPLFGIPAAMGLSFTTTYKALSFFLNELAGEAQEVFKVAIKLNTRT